MTATAETNEMCLSRCWPAGAARWVAACHMPKRLMRARIDERLSQVPLSERILECATNRVHLPERPRTKIRMHTMHLN